MAESTISSEATERETLSVMNYQAAQLAAGLNMSKRMSGQLTSLSMNIGKVNANLNTVNDNLVQINNMQKAVNMNIGKVTKAVNDMEKSVVAAILETKKGQLNSSTMTTKMNVLASKQDETNRILSDIMNSFGGSSKYDTLESKIESKDTVSLLMNMSESLTSIDETLKRMEKNGGGTGSSSSGGGAADSISSAAAGAGGAAASYTLMELLKRYGAQGLRFAGKGLAVGATLGVADYAGGQIFGYGDTPDLEQDKKNQSRMNWANKIEDRMARIVEDTLGLISTNSANALRKNRIYNTTEYFAEKDRQAAEEARMAEIKKRDSENWNKMSLTEKFWSAPGRAKDQVLSYVPLIGEDIANYNTETREYLESKALTPKSNSRDYKVPENVSGFNFDINKLKQPEAAKIVETKETPPPQLIAPASNVITGTGEIPKLERNSNVIPYFPSDAITGITNMDISSAFNTRDVLEQQQAQIERQSKEMTSGDMIVEAVDVLYKATNIRFEAGNIQFIGGAMGAAGEAMAGGGGGLPSTSATGPGGMFGGQESGGSGEGATEQGPVGAARLTPEEKTAIDALEKTGTYSVGASEATALGALPVDKLASMGITKKEVRGAGGGTSYSYTKPEGGLGVTGPRAGLDKDSKLLDSTGTMTTSSVGVDQRQFNAYRQALAGIESGGGNYGIVGGAGNKYNGAYQFGNAAMQDAAKALGVPVPSREEFLKNPEMQEKFLDAFTSQNHKTLMKISPEYRNMSPEERLGVLGYAHNQGAGGAANWLKTGQAGKDGFGTLGTKYSDEIKTQLDKTKGDQSLADAVGNALPDKPKTANGVKPIEGGAKVIESYGPKRPGRPNEGIRDIAQVAATESGMSDITFTSGKGNWNSSWVKKGGKTMHSTGNALDAVGFESEEQRAAFIENAVAAGANGIGVYGDGSVHIDTGKFRSWAAAKKKIYQDAISKGMERRKKGDIPGTDGNVAAIAKETPDLAEEAVKNNIPKPRPKPDKIEKTSGTTQASVKGKSIIDAGGERPSSEPAVAPVKTSGGTFMTNPTQRPYDAGDPNFAGSGLVGNRFGKNIVDEKKSFIFDGANSPFAAGVESYNPNLLTPRSVMDHFKGVYSQGYQTTPNTKTASDEAAALQRSWSGADDLGADFPLPGGMEAPMTNIMAGYEDKPAAKLTQASQSAAAVRRTENLKREEARTNDRRREEKKRDDDRMTQAIKNRESPEPKHPTSTRRQLDSVLVRHNDWWKNFNATA